MKKVLVIVLILAAAGRAFPEGFRFGGYVNSGIGVFFPDPVREKRPGRYTGSGSPFVRLVSPDAGAAGWRAQFNAMYTNEEKDLGFNLGLRAQDSSDGAFFDYGYGWFTAFGDAVKVLGGKIDDDTFAARDLIFADDNGESYGLLTIFRPANLLRIGFGAYAGIAPSSSLHSPLDNGKYTASLALIIPDVFRITASYRNANRVEQTTEASFIQDNPPGGSGKFQDSQVYAGIDMDAFRAIGLMFSFVGVINNLQDRDSGIARIFESLSYTGIKGLSLNLALWQAGARYKIINEDKTKEKDSAMSFRLWFWASYDLGRAVPRLDLNYLYAGYIDNIYRLHYDDRYAPNFDAEAGLFTLRPSIAFKVNPHAWLELGYYFIKFIGNEKKVLTPLVYYRDNASGYGATHIAYADMKISF